MKRRRMIYEGKAKILYEGPEPGTVIQYFKDDTTAFDAAKKATIESTSKMMSWSETARTRNKMLSAMKPNPAYRE